MVLTEVIVIFHNLKGYHGTLILQHCYAKHQEGTDQITVGTKVPSLRSDRLTFKDSLSKSFLPFPLANSSATFGTTELCNGFFPYKFNTQENVYSTRKKTNIMKDPCHPKKCTIQMACRPKRKLNLNNGTKRRSMTISTLSCEEKSKPAANLTSNSSKPDVKSFARSQWNTRTLNPLKSVSLLPPLAIASGVKTRAHKSIQALKWLTWCEHQLPHSSRNHIRTVRNRGEVCVANHLADWFNPRDPITQRPTLYKVHGCLWNGCPRWLNHARSVRVHTPKTQTTQTMWLRCQRTMGMWVGHWSQNQSRPTTISQHLQNNRYAATQRCLLRR